MDSNCIDLFESELFAKDANTQKIEWRKKAWSIPDLRGSKHEWFQLVKELVGLVASGQVAELDSYPQVKCSAKPQTWRMYSSFLKFIGFVNNQAGILCVSEQGKIFHANPTKRLFADFLHSKLRLFGEVLAIISYAPSTVEAVDEVLCSSYQLDWNNVNNTRRRMDWLEVLGLIQDVGNRKWKVTSEGYDALNAWILVAPQIINQSVNNQSQSPLSAPPPEIAVLLQQLKDSPEMHKKRCTYNIWAPSPNRIDNLRLILQFASERVSRNDFFKFIQTSFNLKESSVESMMPFLKAAGLLEEVGRNTYLASPAAQGWLRTGADLDFIRILHSKMRFVGEMIFYAQNDIVRNDLYAAAKPYGINTEKARWIAGFLIEAGLLEEPQYLHLKATPTGLQFLQELPLQELSDLDAKLDCSKESEAVEEQASSKDEELFERLHCAATDPMAEGKASGVAFEERIADVFRYMGFSAARIGGAGNTDVVVRWSNNEGRSYIAIIDGKSKSTGMVSHTDVSDVAIDTHKEKNNADYVAIIGPGFSGDTIKNHARKKGFALITDTELADIARSSKQLGLSLQEIGQLFNVPKGLSQLEELISSKQRELDIISEVVSKLSQEQEELGSLSPRDMFLLLRTTNISPTLEELLSIFKTLSQSEIGLLIPVSSSRSPENTTYIMRDEQKTTNRLRALADAIESGCSK